MTNFERIVLNVYEGIWEGPVAEADAKKTAAMLMREAYNEMVLMEGRKDIEMTELILLKNGFEKRKDGYGLPEGCVNEYYLWSDDFHEVGIREWSDSIWVVTVKNLEHQQPNQRLMFSYLRELRQFLRMCAVDLNVTD